MINYFIALSVMCFGFGINAAINRIPFVAPIQFIASGVFIYIALTF
jgi:hypothetical protein